MLGKIVGREVLKPSVVNVRVVEQIYDSYLNMYFAEPKDFKADEGKIKMLQGKCRKSSLRLVCLLANSTEKFQDRNVPEPLGHLAGVSRKQLMMQLDGLSTFFCVFGNATWLGEMVAKECGAEVHAGIVQALLEDLASPQVPQVHLDWARNTLHTIFSQLRLLYKRWPCNVWAIHSDFLFPERPPNELPEAQKQEWNILWPQCTLLQKFLARYGEPSLPSWHTCEHNPRMEKKMFFLKEFAETCNEYCKVLKLFILTHLGDVPVNDVSILRQWVTEDEVLRAHAMLEEFREEGNTARAVKAVAKATNAALHFRSEPSSGVAGSSAPTEQQNGNHFVCNSDVNLVEIKDGKDCTVVEVGDGKNVEGKRRCRPGHRQRQRQKKFWKAIPKTNSSLS